MEAYVNQDIKTVCSMSEKLPESGVSLEYDGVGKEERT